jgi:TRAP transporter T-component
VGLAAAQEANPGDVAVRLLRARAEAFWSDLHADAPPKDLAAHLSAGVEAAHGAVFLVSPAFARAAKRGKPLADCLRAMGPAGADALYWFGEDQHRLAAVHGLAALLLESQDLRLIFGRVAELAPQTYYGGPYRHLAELSLALPYGWSEGLKVTAAALQQAIVLGPGLLENHLVYAQRWAVKAQDYGRFRDELRQVLEAPEDLAPEIWPENELAKRKARQLLLQASELFTRAAMTHGLDGGVAP